MSLSSLLGKLHITLAPMNGAWSFFIGFDTMDINCIRKGANKETYSSIRVDFQYLVRPTSTKGRLILVLDTLVQHDLVIDMIGMPDSRFVFVLIVLLNQMLLTCTDVFPVHSTDNISIRG
jgi:hypothetical protein